MKYLKLLASIGFGCGIWLFPKPEAVTDEAWQLFAIFAATIFGIIARALPTGAAALFGLFTAIITGSVSFNEAFSGFTNSIVWLIVFSFFVARGFIRSGLGARIGYFFIYLLGARTLGLAYGVVAADLFLAPAIPSNTARAGGILYPIVDSLSRTFESYPKDPSSSKMGSFLTKVAFQSTCISSAMFLTSMAANPLIAELAEGIGYRINWTEWALAAALPGLVGLLLVPLVLYRLFPPDIKHTPEAKAFAADHLKKMGKMKGKELIMLLTFFLLIGFWIACPLFCIKPAVVSLGGLLLLLVFDVLTWDDVKSDAAAWETLVWFAVLVMMATRLNELGFMDWLAEEIVSQIANWNWVYSYLFLSLAYFYSHYLFASILAHASAMYAPFAAVAIALGTPPALAVYTLAFFSSLFGGLTHYACGPAAVFYGAGYVSMRRWWEAGALISLLNIFIWIGLGSLWWKALGLW